MSQISAREDSKSHAARDHWIAESPFRRSGVPTVHIRPTFFSEWLYSRLCALTMSQMVSSICRMATDAMLQLLGVTRRGLSRPSGGASRSCREDLSCGPTELDQAGIAFAITSGISGRKISYQPLTIPQYRERLEKAGLPEFMIQHFARSPRLPERPLLGRRQVHRRTDREAADDRAGFRYCTRSVYDGERCMTHGQRALVAASTMVGTLMVSRIVTLSSARQHD